MDQGCLCDCFASLGSPVYNDKPLDPSDLNKCIQKYRAYLAQRAQVTEQQHPLIIIRNSDASASKTQTTTPSVYIQVILNFLHSVDSKEASYF
ncbi:unnamed protein product [Cylicocyclus nassatus]|uniref:Uncharacterized protein n=1 Tax=Cylicocyclus nassatus TaxID=53992 RepID=A0AA36HA14_CYLNA|nr:unnamed protein product [Cylicocyclus nassatus]